MHPCDHHHRLSRIGILDALLTAEKLEDAMYAHGLQSGVLDSLSDHDRSYFRAAVSEEYSHALVLQHLGAHVATDTFYFPAGSFDSLTKYLDVLLTLENVGISAYSAAIHRFAGRLGAPKLALVAATILGIEAEHRVLIRDVQGQTPPNDLCFEKVTSLSVAENAKALTPFLKANQFDGTSTGPVSYPSENTVVDLAGCDYCRNPSGVVILREIDRSDGRPVGGKN